MLGGEIESTATVKACKNSVFSFVKNVKGPDEPCINLSPLGLRRLNSSSEIPGSIPFVA